MGSLVHDEGTAKYKLAWDDFQSFLHINVTITNEDDNDEDVQAEKENKDIKAMKENKDIKARKENKKLEDVTNVERKAEKAEET